MRLAVEIGALVVQAIGALEEEAAILGASVGGVQESAIEDELVHGEDGERRFALTGVVDVGGEAEALVLALKCFLLVEEVVEAAVVAVVAVVATVVVVVVVIVNAFLDGSMSTL